MNVAKVLLVAGGFPILEQNQEVWGIDHTIVGDVEIAWADVGYGIEEDAGTIVYVGSSAIVDGCFIGATIEQLAGVEVVPFAIEPRQSVGA